MKNKGSKLTGKQPSNSDAMSTEQLLRAIAEKERLLGELTEQSLGFLEELAEAKRQAAGNADLARRLEELERSLADARQRLRHAGGSAPSATADTENPTPALEIVFWGADTATAALASAAAKAGVRVSWVGVPTVVPAQARRAKSMHWVTHRDARTPAQCWNLGMASTNADTVLFLGPGMRLDGEVHLPVAATNPNAAMLCPRVQRGTETTLGFEEADPLLHLRSRPAPPPESASVDVGYPSAQAFLVRRPAFERIGMFHEGLVGSAALLDYAMRARQKSFAIVSAPDLTLQAAADHPGCDDAEDGERLQVLAQHRPEQLGRALADSATLWKREPAAIAGYLRQLLAVLPNSQDLGATRSAMEQIATGVVEHAQPSRRIIAQVQTIRIELLRALTTTEVPVERELAEVALHRAENEPVATVTAAFASLAQDLALDLRIRGALLENVQQLRAERQRLLAECEAQSIRADSAAADGSAVHQQLLAVEKKLARSEQRLDWTGQMLANIQQQLDQSRDVRAAAEQKLAATEQRLADIQQLHDQAQRELTAHRNRLAEVTLDFGAIQQELADTTPTMESLRQARIDAEASLNVSLQTLDEATKTLAKTQARLEETEAELAAQKAAEAEKLQTATEEAARAQAELANRLQTATEEARRFQNDVAKKLQQAAEETARAQSEREALASQRDAMAHERDAIVHERNSMARELQRANDRAHAAESAIADQQRSAEALSQGLQYASDALQKSQAELATVARSVGLQSPPPLERFVELLGMLNRDAHLLAATLAATGATDSAGLVADVRDTKAQLAELKSRLKERESWIALLLQEVAKRRLVGRKLLPHEQSFLTDRQP
jgi:hypothetical protein